MVEATKNDRFTYVNHTNTQALDTIGFESFDTIIEVSNGETVKVRKDSSLTNDDKKHKLVISKAKGDSIEDLKNKHQANAHDDETKLLKAIYNGEAIPHQLAFPKADGSGGEEMKYVYLIVKDKVNLDAEVLQAISDDEGREIAV